MKIVTILGLKGMRRTTGHFDVQQQQDSHVVIGTTDEGSSTLPTF